MPDWFGGPSANQFYLIDGLDRQSINDYIPQNSNNPAIFGINVNPNPAQTLWQGAWV